MFTKTQARHMTAKIGKRIALLRNASKTLGAMDFQLMDVRSDVLWKYDDNFVLQNKYAGEYWSQIETAMEGLYGAQEALKRLVELEMRKQYKISDFYNRAEF